MKVRARFCISNLALATWLCFVAAPAVLAQGKNPYAGDAKMARLGEFEFRANCAFCHGLGARGARFATD